jgi:outer membrane protein OmpA-like peptidoglycan-associated protein
VRDRSIKELKAWYERLLPDVRRAIAEGRLPIVARGYASTTGSVAANQRLARKRVAAVKRILRDFGGSGTKFTEFSLGKLNTPGPDETEDPKQRRVTVEVTYDVP